MKKIIAIVAFSIFVASQASAAAVGSADNGDMNLASNGVQGGTVWGAKGTAAANTAGSILIGKTSTGVGLGWKTSQNAYAILTQHKSGNKEFGSSWDSTSVYYLDLTSAEIGTAKTAQPSASDSTGFTTWTSM